jgi:hypothetical protein
MATLSFALGAGTALSGMAGPGSSQVVVRPHRVEGES